MQQGALLKQSRQRNRLPSSLLRKEVILLLYNTSIEERLCLNVDPLTPTEYLVEICQLEEPSLQAELLVRG